jgi:hypothetical protein
MPEKYICFMLIDIFNMMLKDPRGCKKNIVFEKSSEINEYHILSLNQKIFYGTSFIGSLLGSSIWPLKKLRFQSSKLSRKKYC